MMSCKHNIMTSTTQLKRDRNLGMQVTERSNGSQNDTAHAFASRLAALILAR